MRLALLLASAALLAGCYERPGDGAASGFTVERVDTKEAVADGATQLSFRVLVEDGTKPDTKLTAEVSSGIVNFAADPTAAEARTLERFTAGASDIRIVAQVGVLPGSFLFAATVGNERREKSVDLHPSRADSITLSADRTAVTADGASAVALTIGLWVDPPPDAGDADAADANVPLWDPRVSTHARVGLNVCCLDPNDVWKSCDPSLPLSYPRFVEADDPTAIAVSLVSHYAAAQTPGETRDVIVLADASTDEPTCEPPANPKLQATLPLSLQLVEPPKDETP